MSKKDILLYVNNSNESVRIHRDLEKHGVSFQLIYSSGEMRSVPAIDSGQGTISGYDNIRRYLLPKEEPDHLK